MTLPRPSLAPSGGGWWRLALGLVAYALLAPGAAGLVALPLAGLLLAAGPARPVEWAVAVVAGAAGAATLAAPAGSELDALVSAYVVLASAAFVCIAVLRPDGAFRMAARALWWGGVATAVLAGIVWGGVPWRELGWQATRGVRATLLHQLGAMHQVGGGSFDARVVDGVVTAVSSTVPALLALETLAGFALAWQVHARLARHPLGAPLAPFREFCFGDLWVWAVIASVAVWLVPALAGLRATALNVAVVLGVLYVVRGAAVVAALALAAGVSAGTLALAAVLAMLLAPLLSMVGITDTWLEFRRRLASRPTHL